MPMSKSGRDRIMLMFALTESARALKALEEVERLAALREYPQPGIELRENIRVFDSIRLALQLSANVSKIFWPQRNKERGKHLRLLAGLPENHPLKDRRLRNHIEHMDERLDDWTKESPRPFLTIEMVLDDDDIPPGPQRDEEIDAIAVVYDATTRAVHLFGESFFLPELKGHILDVQGHISDALSAVRAAK